MYSGAFVTENSASIVTPVSSKVANETIITNTKNCLHPGINCHEHPVFETSSRHLKRTNLEPQATSRYRPPKSKQIMLDNNWWKREHGEGEIPLHLRAKPTPGVEMTCNWSRSVPILNWFRVDPP